ncbi:MAG: YchJ family metal-binding protein [Nitrosomonadales bacterium]
MAKLKHCPCGGDNYAACCGPFHAGNPAPDAQRLMRSRYSAYVLKCEDYLLATWHTSTRPASLDFTSEKWLGLDIKKQRNESNTVEFVARYKIDGRAYRLHEISRFVFEEGRWFYLDGEFPASSSASPPRTSSPPL